jgi:hypothetical protein
LRCNFGGHEFGKGSILAGILSRGGKNCYDSYAMMGYVYVLYIMYSFFDTWSWDPSTCLVPDHLCRQ